MAPARPRRYGHPRRWRQLRLVPPAHRGRAHHHRDGGAHPARAGTRLGLRRQRGPAGRRRHRRGGARRNPGAVPAIARPAQPAAGRPARRPGQQRSGQRHRPRARLRARLRSALHHRPRRAGAAAADDRRRARLRAADDRARAAGRQHRRRRARVQHGDHVLRRPAGAGLRVPVRRRDLRQDHPHHARRRGPQHHPGRPRPVRRLVRRNTALADRARRRARQPRR